MQVNRIFHYSLLGLQSTSRNEDESYNLEAAGWSFVPQYRHIIQPAPLDKRTHTHTRTYRVHTNTHMLIHTLSHGEFLEYELLISLIVLIFAWHDRSPRLLSSVIFDSLKECPHALS